VNSPYSGSKANWLSGSTKITIPASDPASGAELKATTNAMGEVTFIIKNTDTTGTEAKPAAGNSPAPKLRLYGTFKPVIPGYGDKESDIDLVTFDVYGAPVVNATTITPVKPTNRPLLVKVSISGGVLTIQMKIDAKSTKAILWSPGLDILKSQPLEGVIKAGVAIFSKPLTNKFSGQKVEVVAASVINGIYSDVAIEEVQIPDIDNSIITPKVTPTPTASKTPTPKATTKKPAPVVTKTPVVMCKKPGQTDRPRIGAECIKGWTEVKR
jgi:hypothetical protein